MGWGQPGSIQELSLSLPIRMKLFFRTSTVVCVGEHFLPANFLPHKVLSPPECLLPSSGRWMCFRSPMIYIRATNQFERSLLVKRFRTVAPKRFSQVATEWLQKLFHVGPSQTWMDVREVPTKYQLKPCDKLSIPRMATRVWY